MTDTHPTATVAGQSIALRIAGYPDLPNRWGSGHIRPISIRLDYGNSHTPNGRHALVTGLWVREDGHTTDDPVDRLYDAHNGDMSDWPGWLAQLVTAHDPSAVPVSSPPPDQTAEVDQLRADLEHETERRQRWQRKYNAEHARHVEVVRSFVTDRAAVLLWAADQIDAETRQAKTDGVLEPDKFRPCRDASAQLRALAGCQECASGLEHNTHCPTPETHNWGCGCPSDVAAAIASCPGYETKGPSPCRCPCYGCKHHCGAHDPSRLAAEAQQPDTETQAHPPIHAWRVETRDPGTNQWMEGSHFAHRPAAVERWETANRTAPLWHDGIPVERRIVRETTTYTVDQPATTDGTGRV